MTNFLSTSSIYCSVSINWYNVDHDVSAKSKIIRYNNMLLYTSYLNCPHHSRNVNVKQRFCRTYRRFQKSEVQKKKPMQISLAITCALCSHSRATLHRHCDISWWQMIIWPDGPVGLTKQLSLWQGAHQNMIYFLSLKWSQESKSFLPKCSVHISICFNMFQYASITTVFISWRHTHCSAYAFHLDLKRFAEILVFLF